MKLRMQVILTFFLALLAALVATDVTYRIVYSAAAVAEYMSSGPAAQRTMGIVMMLVVPFFWVVVFVCAGAWRLGHGFSRPLKELSEALQRLKQRDLDFAITYDGRNELGDLCRAFVSMQGELRASLDREWREQEARREMVAAIAHDLRTPLAVVRSHAEGLLAASPQRRQERMERYLTAIATNADRSAALLTDLLTLSRLEQADMPLQLRPLPLDDALQRWVADYAEMASAQRVTLLAEVEPERADMVMADADRLHQVLDNLVGNALRHTPPGGQASVRLRWTGDGAQISVWDTGPGFAAADLPHLFDRYYQGGGAVGAAGLGLYICQLLVTRHGGHISAANRPEGGSEVTVTLPRRYQ